MLKRLTSENIRKISCQGFFLLKSRYGQTNVGYLWTCVTVSYRRVLVSNYQPERLRWVLVVVSLCRPRYLCKNLLNLWQEAKQIISILLLQDFHPLQNCKWKRPAVKYSYLTEKSIRHFHVKYQILFHVKYYFLVKYQIQFYCLIPNAIFMSNTI